MTYLIQYIAMLQKLADEHGNLPVMSYAIDGPPSARRDASDPKLMHVKILRQGERREKFWSDTDSPQERGLPVVRV